MAVLALAQVTLGTARDTPQIETRLDEVASAIPICWGLNVLTK